MMRVLKRCMSLLGRLIVCACVSLLVWGWIFTFLTDTTPQKKLVVSVCEEVPDRALLEERLAADLPSGIDMLMVHPYSYYAFGNEALVMSDVLILTRQELQAHTDWLAPLPAALSEGAEALWAADGVDYAARLPAAAAERLGFAADPEDAWLAVGARSVHNAENDNAADNHVLWLAEALRKAE